MSAERKAVTCLPLLYTGMMRKVAVASVGHPVLLCFRQHPNCDSCQTNADWRAGGSLEHRNSDLLACQGPNKACTLNLRRGLLETSGFMAVYWAWA